MNSESADKLNQSLVNSGSMAAMRSVATLLVVGLVCYGCHGADEPGASPKIVAQSTSENATEQGVPLKLFDVELGGIYDPGNSEATVGTFPVQNFAGMQKFLGEGVHYYFKPLHENERFPYVEHRAEPSDKYFRTSHRLYLLPVIPPTATLEQLRSTDAKWEVVTIEWSADATDKGDDYAWALDLCKTFAVDIKVKPATKDQYPDLYECTFSSDSREFQVSSFLGRKVSLNFEKKLSEAKSDAVETTRRKLEAREIKAYD